MVSEEGETGDEVEEIRRRGVDVEGEEGRKEGRSRPVLNKGEDRGEEEENMGGAAGREEEIGAKTERGKILGVGE